MTELRVDIKRVESLQRYEELCVELFPLMDFLVSHPWLLKETVSHEIGVFDPPESILDFCCEHTIEEVLSSRCSSGILEGEKEFEFDYDDILQQLKDRWGV